MEEINKNEIMDARAWIEFGKMYNCMTQAGFEVELLCEHTYTDYSISAFDTNTEEYVETDCDIFTTPYLAIKDFYFKYFLKNEEFCDQLVYITNQDLNNLYLESDRLGVPVEEYVIEILRELQPEEPEKVEVYSAYCCYNCTYMNVYIDPTDGSMRVKCNKQGIPTLYGNTCKDYFPRTEK